MQELMRKFILGEYLTGVERLAIAIQCLGIRGAIDLALLDDSHG